MFSYVMKLPHLWMGAKKQNIITMILKNSIVIFVSSFNTPSQLSEKIFF